MADEKDTFGRTGRSQPTEMSMSRPTGVNAHRTIRRPEVQEMTGLARSTVYALVKAGRFPKPLRLGPRAVGWRLADVLEWMEAPERDYDPHEVA